METLRAVRDLRGLSAVEKSVLYAIVLRADSSGRCWPSFTTIAEDAGVCVRAAKSAVYGLEQAGHIAVERRSVEGRKESDSNLYAVKVVHQMHEVVHHVHDVVQGMHEGSAPDARQVVHHVHEGSAPRARELPIELPIGTTQGSTAAPTPHEPAEAKGEKPTKVSRRKSQTAAPDLDATPADVKAWFLRWKIPADADQYEANRFLNNARKKDERLSNWTAAWINWTKSPYYGQTRQAGNMGKQAPAPPGTKTWTSHMDAAKQADAERAGPPEAGAA